MENGKFSPVIVRDYLIKLGILLILIGIISAFGYFTFLNGSGSDSLVTFYRRSSSRPPEKVLEVTRDNLENVSITRYPPGGKTVSRICFTLAGFRAQEQTWEIPQNSGPYEMQVGLDLKDRFRIYGRWVRLEDGSFCVNGRFPSTVIKRRLGGYINRAPVGDASPGEEGKVR